MYCYFSTCTVFLQKNEWDIICVFSDWSVTMPSMSQHCSSWRRNMRWQWKRKCCQNWREIVLWVRWLDSRAHWRVWNPSKEDLSKWVSRESNLFANCSFKLMHNFLTESSSLNTVYLWISWKISVVMMPSKILQTWEVL